MAIIYFISAKDTEKLQAWLHNTFLNTETKQFPCALEQLSIAAFNKPYLKLSIPDEIFTDDIYKKLRATSFTKQFDFSLNHKRSRRTESSPLTWTRRLSRKKVWMR